MDNIASTFSSELLPNTGNSLEPEQAPSSFVSTIESMNSNLLEPVSAPTEQRAVVIPSISTKSNDSSLTKDFPVNEPMKMSMNDNDRDERPFKRKSCCSMLNRLFLALAISSFTLFLCSIAYILLNLDGFNVKYNGHKIEKIHQSHSCSDELFSEQLISDSYFNMTHPNNDRFMVIVSRLGASILDVLIPCKNVDGVETSRSIVVKGGEYNGFGSVRFGFDDPRNSMNMTNQLPFNYPLLNYHRDDWTMYADANKPHRVRFIRGLVQIIYEFSSTHPNEFVMTTMVAPPSDQPIVADPTNNIYFNLRAHGNLSTHYLNISLSSPFNISHGQKVEQDRLVQAQRVDKLLNVNNYFYKLDRAGIGKNHIATLVESETKTTMNVFSNHAGVIIDPFGVGFRDRSSYPAMATPETRGVRISPRQSPIYQPVPLYGPTLIAFPSQAIHTTWWQFQTEF